MKAMLIVVSVLFIFFVSSPTVAAAPSKQLIAALEQVESGGDPDVRPGDHGRALGILQIHKRYWMEGCKLLGVNWDYKTGSRDQKKSEAITFAVLSHYGESYRKATGQEPTSEVYARCHNGGEHGWKNDASRRSKRTLAYWAKVRKHIG